MAMEQMFEKGDRVLFFDTQNEAQQWIQEHWYLVGAHNGNVIQTFNPMVSVQGMEVCDTCHAYEEGLLKDLDFVDVPPGWIVAVRYDAFDGDLTWKCIRRIDEFLEMYVLDDGNSNCSSLN